MQPRAACLHACTVGVCCWPLLVFLSCAGEGGARRTQCAQPPGDLYVLIETGHAHTHTRTRTHTDTRTYIHMMHTGRGAHMEVHGGATSRGTAAWRTGGKQTLRTERSTAERAIAAMCTHKHIRCMSSQRVKQRLTVVGDGCRVAMPLLVHVMSANQEAEHGAYHHSNGETYTKPHSWHSAGWRAIAPVCWCCSCVA